VIPLAKTKQPTIAIMYDFDKTLCTKDMQEYAFIPSLGMSAAEFWRESAELSGAQKMDRILAYLYLMVRKSRDSHVPIKRDRFVELGKSIEYFPGVEGWFDRIAAFAKEQGATVEHYIISSGLKEIIEGCGIAKKFKEIYACEFLYDENDTAAWPKLVVNYTTKTQFLFRVNKGVLDISDDDSLNRYLHDDDRRIPFRNMIYIGDGLTDVPCMKLVKVNGGQSIAVHPKGKKDTVAELLRDDRVDYVAVADYSEDGDLDRLVRDIVRKMVADDGLARLHREQLRSVKKG